jgi:hypothetical protein
MMRNETPIVRIRERVNDLEKQVRDLYDLSDDFPAVNRNVKRILASLEMLRINVERVAGPDEPM